MYLLGADEKLPMLIYKEGEPLRELSRFLAEGEGQLVEVRIPAESMSNANRQVRQSSLHVSVAARVTSQSMVLLCAPGSAA